jgi:hypothetical protein
MKSLSILLLLVSLTGFTSCRWSDHDITIHYNDNKRYYSMEADFDEHKTRAVEEYMDKRLGSVTNMSFINTKLDGQLVLDDHTNFYIEKYAGYLRIKLDKEKNSYSSYERIRSMCDGLKKVLTR